MDGDGILGVDDEGVEVLVDGGIKKVEIGEKMVCCEGGNGEDCNK